MGDVVRMAAAVAAVAFALAVGMNATQTQGQEVGGLLAGGWGGWMVPHSPDPAFGVPVYDVPMMMGVHEGPFATPIQITAFPATQIIATYTGATAQLMNNNINQPVTFSFMSTNPNPLLPDIAGIASTPPPLDLSGDGNPGTFVGLPEVPALTQTVAANAPFPGTITFNRGQAVFVSPTAIAFQSQTLGSDPAVLLPEADGSVVAAENNPNFNGYQLQFFYQFLRGPFNLVIPHPSSASLTGRTRISQNGSVTPRTRAYLDYSLLESENLNGGFTFRRFTPGIERSFFGGMASAEVRMPIASTADAAISADSPFTEGNVEFGDMSLALKALLIRLPRFAFSGGVQFTLPTADDVTVSLADGTRVLEVENQAVHVMPFLGAVYDSPSMLFTQMFAQFDIDANGNSVQANPTLAVGGPLLAGPELHDTDRFYLSLATGVWLYRACEPPCGRAGLLALAPTLELHYAQDLEQPETIRVGALQVGDPNADTREQLDVVLGGSAVLQSGTLSAGVGVPVTGDKTHDWEFRLLFNRALR